MNNLKKTRDWFSESIRLDDKDEKKLNIAAMLIAPTVLLVLMERMYINTPVSLRITNGLLVLNYLFWLLFCVLLFFVSGRLRTALRIQTVFMFMVGLLNYYLHQFRGMPFQPWDIFSIRTALSVADNYSFAIPLSVFVMIALFVLIFLLAGLLRLETVHTGRYRIIIRICAALSTTLFLCIIACFIQWKETPELTGMLNKLFVQDEMTERNGTAVTFLYDLQYVVVKAPEGYSKERALELLNDAGEKSEKWQNESESYTVEENASDTVRPDIIVIMNETFSDLRLLGEFETNEEVMPFTDSMMSGADNTVSGYLTVPVLGGNTANTEFEFLTGNSMRWFPEGSIPYQQYIKAPMDTIVSELRTEGYETVAVHPYGEKGWNRDKIYDLFGFERFLSEKDFDDPKMIRNYISDESDYDKVLELYKDHQDDGPIFIFNITMQNHGAYWEEYDNFEPQIIADGIGDKEFNCYLSLIHESDKATAQLVDSLKESDRPVILLFFGDHQPADTTVDELYVLNGGNVDDLDDEGIRMRHLVPFYMWTNYESEEETDVRLTSYELGIRLLEQAGVKPNEYQNFVRSYCEGQYTDEDHSVVQYYEMFDKE